jgi:hypothetical protein
MQNWSDRRSSKIHKQELEILAFIRRMQPPPGPRQIRQGHPYRRSVAGRFHGVSFHKPMSLWTSKAPTLLGAQRISLLTPVVNYSSTTSPQFGPRWYKSYPGHNEEDFQHKQQEVHDLSPVFAVD